MQTISSLHFFPLVTQSSEMNEPKDRLPQQRLGLGRSLSRKMEIIGNALEKRSTYGHERGFCYNKSDVYLPFH